MLEEKKKIMIIYRNILKQFIQKKYIKELKLFTEIRFMIIV